MQLFESPAKAGTYIRTMARDMGLLLDTPVSLKELRRERSGMFDLNHCVTMDQPADAVWLWKECGEEDALNSILHPIEKLLVDVPRCTVKDSAVAAPPTVVPRCFVRVWFPFLKA